VSDAEAVPDVVDPTPIIDEGLKALAVEYEPRLKELDEAIAQAKQSNRRRLKRQRRRERRAYRSARRKVQGLSRSAML
jgi:hypothetical protein